LKFIQLIFLIGFYGQGALDLRFGDETNFSMMPNVPYGWLPKGKQGTIASDSKRVLNVFGLMNFGQQLSTYPTKGSINSDFIIEVINDFSKTVDKLTVIVLDNAPWHTSNKIKEQIENWEEEGIFIFYLPTYSPHLNPIEILWRKVKYEWLKPKNFESPEILKNAILNIFQKFGNEFSIRFSKNLSL